MSEFTNIGFEPLQDADFIRAATSLGCEVSAIKAVAEIEGGRAGGYLPSGRPVILFESRLFNDLTDGRYRADHPDIATSTWVRNYRGGDGEYERLRAGMALDPEAALKSCSWGRFQILGANYSRLGFKSVNDYVTEVVDDGEASHLSHFVGFVVANGITDELIRLDWHGFARVYNGPGYRKNRYATRMQSAYERFRRGDVMMHDGKLMTNKDLQRALMRHGFLPPHQDDGIIGPQTTAALKDFEDANGLKVNGVIDGTEWGALLREAT